MKPVYRAEVLGSMLRPDCLTAARKTLAAGELSPAEFKRVEDRAVDEALATQERAGVDVLSDGEMRREFFISPLVDGVEGYVPASTAEMNWHTVEGEEIHFELPASIGERLQQTRSLVQEEFAYARGRTRKPLKVTVPSPVLLGYMWNKDVSTRAYNNPVELFEHATQIVKQDITSLVQLGCEYIQVDAPEISTLVDTSQANWWRSVGVEPERMLHEGVDLLNSLPVAGTSTTFAIHFCKGNAGGWWLSAGGYEAISAEVFPRAENYDVFLLEYDDDRSGGFEPLNDIPESAIISLGLVSTKRGELEQATDIRRRIESAAQIVPLERLSLSTQCGFSTNANHPGPCDQDMQFQKLKLIADVAHEIWN